MAKFPVPMGDLHGDLQTSPQHADPHGLGAQLRKTIQEIHVDRRVVGWSTGRHVDRPCGGQILPWPARRVTDQRLLSYCPRRNCYWINSGKVGPVIFRLFYRNHRFETDSSNFSWEKSKTWKYWRRKLMQYKAHPAIKSVIFQKLIPGNIIFFGSAIILVPPIFEIITAICLSNSRTFQDGKGNGTSGTFIQMTFKMVIGEPMEMKGWLQTPRRQW